MAFEGLKNKGRYRFIEAMLVKYGELNRCHIERGFGIACAAASRTVTAYRQMNPDAITPYKKRFTPSKRFKPLFISPNDADKIIEAVELLADEPVVRFTKVLS